MSVNLFKQVKLLDLRAHGIKNAMQCKYLLEVLADYAHEKNGNLCFPEQSTIAKRMNIHPKTVYRLAKELTRGKIIFITKRTGTSNTYEINPEILPRGNLMNIAQNSHAPTITTTTQSSSQSVVTPDPEQPYSIPKSNGTPLTLINLNNSYFITLKKENPSQYRKEMCTAGKEIGFTDEELAKMPLGELEIVIQKQLSKSNSEQDKEKNKMEALEALRNFKFKRA